MLDNGIPDLALQKPGVMHVRIMHMVNALGFVLVEVCRPDVKVASATCC